MIFKKKHKIALVAIPDDAAFTVFDGDAFEGESKPSTSDLDRSESTSEIMLLTSSACMVDCSKRKKNSTDFLRCSRIVPLHCRN